MHPQVTPLPLALDGIRRWLPPLPRPPHKILVDIVQELLRQSTSTNQAVAAVTYLSIHAPADLRGTPRLQILEAALQEAAGEGFQMDAGAAVHPGGGGDAADSSGSSDGSGKDAASFGTEGGERGRTRAMNGGGNDASSTLYPTSTSTSTATATAAGGGGGKVKAPAAADSNTAWPSQLNPIPVR